MRHIRTSLIAGILTLIPILVVWFVLDFILALLAEAGSPVARGLGGFIIGYVPSLAPLFMDPLFQWIAGVIVALLLIYSVGVIASRMVGRRLIALLEGLVERIPLVQTIYSASKKLISVLQQKPDGASRIVLINFPQERMKAVGIVMRTMKDAHTGEEIAAVYVPTTPNPTSGYLELVPVKYLTPTDMTMDQAMTMIVSGGAIMPADFSMFPPPDPEGQEP
jgi:uncharacterized membrane protein